MFCLTSCKVVKVQNQMTSYYSTTNGEKKTESKKIHSKFNKIRNFNTLYNT